MQNRPTNPKAAQEFLNAVAEDRIDDLREHGPEDLAQRYPGLAPGQLGELVQWLERHHQATLGDEIVSPRDVIWEAIEVNAAPDTGGEPVWEWILEQLRPHVSRTLVSYLEDAAHNSFDGVTNQELARWVDPYLDLAIGMSAIDD